MFHTKNNKQQAGLDTSARPWLYASITITILLIGILVWHLVYSYNLLTSFKNRVFVIEQSSWQLRLNAETMKLSALVSASTGNLKWKKTYQKTRANLKPTLRKIRGLTQSREVDRLTGEIKKHLEIITDIEDDAFALVKQGKKKEAFKLLSGWQYAKNQRKFSDKIQVLKEAIHERLEQSISFGTTRISLLIVFGGLVILFLLWTITLKTWREQNREKLAAENAQRQSENYYRTVFETSGTAMCILDDDISISQVNANFEELTGYSKQEIEGKKYATEFVHPDDLELIKENHYLRRQDPDNSPRRYEFRFMNRQNEVRNIDLFVDMIPGTAQTIVSGIDITERKQMEQELKDMSLHDSLTGLYNRNFFEEEMQRLSDGRYNPLGILVCDLDGLKFINDTLGHQDGDRIITIISGILQRNFRSSDIIARIGGDEFAVLLPNTPRDTVKEKVQALRRAMQDYNKSDPEIPLSLSVGHAVNEEEATDMEALFREADNRMYRDKMQREERARGRGGC